MLSVIHPGSTQQSYPSSYQHDSLMSHFQPQRRWFTPPLSSNPWIPPTSSSYFFQSPTYSTCYTSSSPSSSFNSSPSSSSSSSSSPYGASYSNPTSSSRIRSSQPRAKDYSKPLFVDCSIEYELPNAPKVPKNSEPILMIHPDYCKRKAKTASSSTTSCSPLHSVKKSSSSSHPPPPPPMRQSRGTKRTFSQVSSEEIMLSQGRWSRESLREKQRNSNQYFVVANFMQHQLHFNNNNNSNHRNNYEHIPFYNNSSSNIPSKRHCNDLTCLQRMKQEQILHYQQHLQMNLWA